jgi:hypothetical protein
MTEEEQDRIDDDLRKVFGISANERYNVTHVSSYIHFFELRKRGIFEYALVEAISNPKLDNRSHLPLIHSLLQQADRQKLLEGHEPPSPLPTTLYRGVYGTRRYVRKGVSWTSSYKQALSFANRFNGLKPAVYAVEVTPQDICAYLGEREQEYILLLPSNAKIHRVKSDPADLATAEKWPR